jgi:hypothetical protein
MRRIILWIILGGIALIAGVIVFQLFGTYLYLRSPERAVDGAFERLVDAKSFDLEVTAQDDAKDGLSFNVSGLVDKRVLTAPVSDLQFSFNAPRQSFSGSGQAQAKDGSIYLRFDRIEGIPKVLPDALQSIWAGLDVQTLLAVGRDRLFPGITTDFTQADLQAIVAIARRHIPFTPIKTEMPVFVDNVLCTPYRVVLSRPALLAIFTETKTAVKGAPLSADEQAELARVVGALPSVAGEIWVAKNDGTLREALLVAKTGDSSFHIDLRFSGYNKSVSVTPPVGAQPLISLIRRLASASLAGVKLQLPFDIPVPILDVNMGVPTVPEPVSGSSKTMGPLPNLIKLFYGTDQPFQQ